MASVAELFCNDHFGLAEGPSGDRFHLNTNVSIQSSTNEQPRLPPSDVKFTFAQCYGKPPDSPDVMDGDILSSLQYNKSGDLLAVGDRGGRVTIYKRDSEKMQKLVNYKPYLQFTSHEPEFDYLKSIEIEEKVIQMKWVPRDTNARFLLSSNDKTIKLWKIGENKFMSTSNKENIKHTASSINKLVIPKPAQILNSSDPVASLRKSYSNAHSYHINTVAVNSDQETFISSDDLRINLWNLEVTDQCFVIVDIKPESMESLQEVITTCTFHPSRCNIFAYSTSRAVTKLCDMRISALCDRHAKLFHEDHGNCRSSSLFSEIVQSISDGQFSNSGRYLATRDYLNIKIWDTMMESKPLQTIPIHGFLKNHLHNLYENDSIFDKFSVGWSSNDTKLVTGSYDSLFNITERSPCKSSLLEIPKECSMPGIKVPLMKPKRVVDTLSHNITNGGSGAKGKNKEQEIVISNIDLCKKVIVSQWSPTENVLALATNNNLYIFQEKR